MGCAPNCVSLRLSKARLIGKINLVCWHHTVQRRLLKYLKEAYEVPESDEASEADEENR